MPVRGVKLQDLGFSDEDSPQPNLRQDVEREKSKSYLAKCAAEITYHVMPAAHPIPELTEQDLSNHIFHHPSPSQPVLQEPYIHPQPVQQQAHGPSTRQPPQQNYVAGSRDLPVHPQQHVLSPAVDHEDYPTPHVIPQVNNAIGTSRDTAEKRSQELNQIPVVAMDGRNQPLDQHSTLQPPLVSALSNHDAYGKPSISSLEPDAPDTGTEARGAAEEGWSFGEASPAPPEPARAGLPVPPRSDTDVFPSANLSNSKSPPRLGSSRRKSSGMSRRRSDGSSEIREMSAGWKGDSVSFRVRFALRGHLDVVRSVIFTGGGSPSEPELCTAGDDGSVKRWIIPTSYRHQGSQNAVSGNDLDITSYFTHRGHGGAVTALAACCASPNFSNGGRVLGDGWVFSGGQDASVKVWERGRVDAKATLDGHTDAVWALCVLPGSGGKLSDRNGSLGGSERVLLASGGADGKILIWSVSAPPQLSSPHSGSNRGTRSSRRANSVSAGSNFPSSPQPSTATTTPFHHTLVHQIVQPESPSPTCISPLSPHGDQFVVSYANASILVFDARSGEEVVGMASLETYDGTPSTGVNSVVARTVGLEGNLGADHSRGLPEEDGVVHGATGTRDGVEGVIISGYEDRYIRFFDANSGKLSIVAFAKLHPPQLTAEFFFFMDIGQCTYTMLAHPSAISSLSLSPDGRELVSAGHDASLRFWSLEKRSCTQEITSHRLMRGEGVCSIVWSQDGRWVVSAGGDGVVKVFSR